MSQVQRSLLLMVPVTTAYQVVADVQAYAEFLPGCEAVEILDTRVLADGASEVLAKVTASARGLRQEFITANLCQPSQRIQMSLRDGPFERLEGCWTFKALGAEGCRVALDLDFVAKGLLMKTLGGAVGPVSDRMVDAFAERIQAKA